VEPFELFCCLLEFGDLAVIGLDAFAWSKSRPNRAARRDAKRHDMALPARSGWHWAFLILAGVAVVLTALVMWKWGGLLLRAG
jgi:hypothetical protein